MPDRFDLIENNKEPNASIATNRLDHDTKIRSMTSALSWDAFPECGCPCCAFGASAWNEQKDEIKRLRSALEKIKTLKPLDPDGGGWGDPYYEMCVSHIAIATEALMKGG